MGRESGRRRNRREVQYKLTTGGSEAVERRSMTPEELQHFIAAIDKGRKNEFGLVKLSLLNLDALFPSPASLTWTNETTLLNYAASRRADGMCDVLVCERVCAYDLSRDLVT